MGFSLADVLTPPSKRALLPYQPGTTAPAPAYMQNQDPYSAFLDQMGMQQVPGAGPGLGADSNDRVLSEIFSPDMPERKRQDDIYAAQARGFKNPGDELQHNEDAKLRLAGEPARQAGMYDLEAEKVKAQASMAKPPSGATRVMNGQDENGVDTTYLVNPAGEIVRQMPTQLPAAMKREKADLPAQIKTLDDLIAAGGPDNNFAATGKFDTGLSKILNPVGLGSQQNINFRVALKDLRAEMGHARYGSALTKQEIQQMDGYLPNEWDADSVMGSKLRVARAALQRRMDELASGQTVDAATPMSVLLGIR